MGLIEFCVVQTTIDNEDKAQEIAAALLEKKLAACIQIAPVQSNYVWKGAVACEKEFLLSIKARATDFPLIAETIRALHSYEVPEIIALPILAGDSAYLHWIVQATRRDEI